MAHRDIRIGMIGSGFMGRTYSECLHRYVQGGRLAAVAGGQRAPGLAADYGVSWQASAEDLICNPEVDAVIITTPEMVHLEQTELAADAGKHVLVEKPMAPTAEQCTAMIAACDEADVTLMVVQSQRFREVNRRARQLLLEGRVGELRQLRHWLHQPLQMSRKEVDAKPFYLDPAGGGLYMGFGVHSFDMVHWLAGADPQTIFAQTADYGDHAIPFMSLMAQVSFANGVLAQVWFNGEMPTHTFPNSGFATQLVGSTGLLGFDGYTHLDMATEAGWERIWEQVGFDLSNPEDPVRLKAYVALVQEFVDAIHERRRPSVTGEDGRTAVALCEAAIQSARSGQPVSLSLSDREL